VIVPLAAFLNSLQAGRFPSPALSGSGSAGVISGITSGPDAADFAGPAKTVNHPDIGVR
jgi:hypothetical protein